MVNGAKTDPSSTPSAPPDVSGSIRNWVDVIAKLIGAVAVAFVTYIAATYQSRASLSSVINQREQAESQLRASMLSDLVEPIIGKNGATSGNADPKRQLLLAEMVTLNFHDHFEFKPMLEEVDAKLARDDHDKIASVARRVIDRQINMLTSIDGISRDGSAGYPAKTTSINLWKQKNPSALSSGSCIAEHDLSKFDNFNEKLVLPASICLSSPDYKICLLLSFYWNAQKNTVAMSPIAYPNSNSITDCNSLHLVDINKQNENQQFEEASLSIFDFPLTDNAKIGLSLYDKNIVFPFTNTVIWRMNEYRHEYRFSVSIYRSAVDNATKKIRSVPDKDKDRSIELRFVWFPEGYVTERERPPPMQLR